MKKLVRLILFCCLGLMMATTGTAQNIDFQFRDTSSLVNTIIDVPVTATSTLTGRGVLSYALQFTYPANNLSVEGVVTGGTISAAFGIPTINTAVPGVVTIAGAGSAPLSGIGNFIFIRFKILQAGTSSITNTGSNNNYFNEGDPVLNFLNVGRVNGIGLPVIAVNPISPVMLRGETLQFTATGGASPYTWSTSNNSVSGISATGLLTATAVGFTEVTAVDANAYSGKTNLEIRGYRLSIPDTTGPYNTYMSMPVRVSDLSGLNVVSGSFNITYNQVAFTDISIETTSSLLQNFSPPVTNLSTPGTIQISFAGSSPLVGAGVLFFIRGKLSNPAGSSTAFTFQNATLNEDLLAIIKNGSVNYGAPPAISISPNTGQLVFGDSLLLTVNGANATPPFNWTVSEQSLATVGANRYLKVTRSGQVTISVSDANSATATTGIFQLYDTYLRIGDASGVVGQQVEIPISIKALPPGQDVLSMQGKIFTSNPSLFTLTDIVTAGTASSTYSVSTSSGANFIQFALAGTTPLPGNSLLFKVRGTLNPAAPPGLASTLSLQDLLLNEGTPLPFIQNGSVSAVVVYTFIGNGNWDVASNWSNNAIPPAFLPANREIIIDPDVNGECVLNVAQTLASGSKFTVKAVKKFRIMTNLSIQ